VIALRTGDAEAFNLRGFARVKAGDATGAMQDFNRAIELKSDFEMAYFNRGSMRSKRGDMKGACADMKRASELGDGQATEFVRTHCGK
jgi:Flp pilus assembly protein TadD